METYPNFTKLRIIRYVEGVLFVVRLAFLVYLLLAIYEEFFVGYGEEDVPFTFTNGALLDIGDMILAFVYDVIATIGFVFLLLGYKKKNHKMLGICLLASFIALPISILIEVISWWSSEERRTGDSAIIIFALLIIYRGILIKIIYKARQELKATPFTVPFAQMRNCEETV